MGILLVSPPNPNSMKHDTSHIRVYKAYFLSQGVIGDGGDRIVMVPHLSQISGSVICVIGMILLGVVIFDDMDHPLQYD